MNEDNVKAIQDATALLLQDLAQRTSDPGVHRDALSLRSRVLARSVERPVVEDAGEEKSFAQKEAEL